MKKIKTIITILCLLPFWLPAQTLTVNNKEAAITVKGNTTVKIQGNYLNKQGGRMKNAGIINLNGNWTKSSSNAVFTNTGGLVKFTGIGSQEIGGATTTFNYLDFDAEVTLHVNTLVSQNMNFSSGYLYLYNYDLQMLGSAGITGISQSQYIVADEGNLIRNVSTTEQYFPVGTAFEFAPVVLVNNSGSDEFAVNIFSDVLDNGTTGSTISDIEKTVKHTWVITDPDGSISNPNFDLDIYWNGSMEGNDFNRINASISQYNGSNWQMLSAVGAFGNDPYSISQSSVTGMGAFTVKSVLLNFTLDMKAFLEGPFKTSNMGANLTGIPLSQPYNTSPWNYAGNESVTSIPNANVVDWVLVELRDATSAGGATSSTRLARQAAFVLKDGSVVGTDGSSMLQFNVSVTNNLYAIVWHRNHLGIMSATALTESGGVYTYNFTTAVNKAYQSGQKSLGGKAAMFGGDVNGNGTVNTADKTVWSGVAGTKGYLSSDMNMDSQVDNKDKNDIWVGNVNEQTKVPN